MKSGGVYECSVRSQQGSMLLLFAGIILPLSLVLLAVSVDMQGYSTAVSQAQRVADEAARFGTRFAPDYRSAVDAARMYVAKKAQFKRVDVSSRADEVRVEVKGGFTPFFGELLSVLAGQEFHIPVTAYARAKSNPYDVFIGIDRSRRVGPGFSESDTEAWGSPGAYGTASLFETVPFEFDDGNILHPRIATQQCWNPTFGTLKGAAIRLFDYFAGFPRNRVGVSFFPGATSAVGRTRNLQDGVSIKEEEFFLDTHVDWDEDRYVTVEEQEARPPFVVQSVHCAAAAEREGFFERYAVPRAPEFLGESHFSGNLVDTDTWRVNPDFPLTARERMWSRVLHPSADMDFVVALGDAERALFGSGSHEERGGLVTRASQVAIFLSEGKPRSGDSQMNSRGDSVGVAIDEALARIGSRKQRGGPKLSLFYVSLGSDPLHELESLFAERVVTVNGETVFEPRVVRPRDGEELLEKITAVLAVENRGGVVSR